ncbi:unnamed protein product [Danaus chrysippus]|uniref:(African queen) hypothetical protein n=1 Tax=Danaus chrysippus TaxID=151541 RepID=A0A8J2MXE7_9NEOP|nr:unnamed protein product [Danaus chrysippus]
MSRLVIICCLVIFCLKGALGLSTPVAQCRRNNGSLPLNAYVLGCLETPCLLPQNQNAVIDVVFKAPYLLYDMKSRAVADIFNNDIDYNLEENAVTCNFITNSYCPILEGEVVEYSLKMFISSSIPTVAISGLGGGCDIWYFIGE